MYEIDNGPQVPNSPHDQRFQCDKRGGHHDGSSRGEE